MSSRRPALRALMVCVALLAVSLTFADAPAATTCASPPAVFPESSITPGMAGTGLTAVQGSAPTAFDIQVIGIFPNALLPSFDLVIFRITGPPAFLDQAHGVASGMSGSPIYIGGQLAGAVSYTFGLAADPMIGLFTPAQQMVDLTALPTCSATSLPSSISASRDYLASERSGCSRSATSTVSPSTCTRRAEWPPRRPRRSIRSPSNPVSRWPRTCRPAT